MPLTSPSRITGKERDAETGLDYFGARYYSSNLGRFTSPDLPFADQHVANPQSWNLYSYTFNNPLRYVDDDGLAVIVAPSMQKTVDEIRRIPSVDAVFREHEGEGAPNLTIREGDPGPDPYTGAPRDGDTTSVLRGTDPATYKESVVTIRPNSEDKKETTKHEIGHVKDTKRNPEQAYKDQEFLNKWKDSNFRPTKGEQKRKEEILKRRETAAEQFRKDANKEPKTPKPKKEKKRPDEN